MAGRKSSKRRPEIRPGFYAHYRGGHYCVLQIALDAETEAEMVIYRALEDGRTWVRPLAEFASDVEAFGERYRRFTPIEGPSLFFDAGIESAERRALQFAA